MGNIVTKIPFTDILLAVGSIALLVWLLWAGFNPKKGGSSDSSTKSTKSSASKPAGSGININISNGASGGDNESNTGQSN